MRRRPALLVICALVLIAMAVRHPSADIRVLTHDAGDQSPQQVRAAIDIGVMAVSVLVTWSSKRLIGA